MSPIFIATLGGLIGSILTTLTARIFDLIQKKNEFNYGLRKSFFERKLRSAEAAIAQMYLFSSCLKNLSFLLAEISRNLTKVLIDPPDFLRSLFEGNLEQLKKAADPIYGAANAILLYFDLDKFGNSVLFKESMNLVMSINWRQRFLSKLFEDFFKTNNTAEKDEVFKSIKGLIEEMRSDTSNLSEKINEGEKEIFSIIKEVRANMKNYDSPSKK